VLFDRDISDLIWFFRDAAGEMGEHSSFGAMIALLQTGGPTGGYRDHEVNERQLAAARRARPIYKALEASGENAKRVLYMAYGGEKCTGFEAFGTVAPFVLASPVAGAAYRASSSSRSFDDWLKRLSKRHIHGTSSQPAKDRLLIREIIVDSELALHEAMRQYTCQLQRVSMRTE
jgi:hypothetical protein